MTPCKLLSAAFLVPLLACILACAPGKPRIESPALGSDLEHDGSMRDASLSYVFPPFNRGKTVRDLFNYLYFQGDTLCFTFRVNRHLEERMVRGWFVNPRTGKSYPVERIDVHEERTLLPLTGEWCRVSGFSLVGSLMEDFYKGDLEKPMPRDRYSSSAIPFEIRLEVDQGEEILRRSLAGSFTIRYKDR